MPRLTKKLTEGAPVTNKHQYIWDDQLPGFGLRVLPSGNKTFVVQYRYGKRIRKLTIGRYPIFGADQARVEATKILASVRSGEDPMAKKTERKTLCTVEDLARRYLDEYCVAYLKARTRYKIELMLSKHILPELGDRNVRDVGRPDIAELHLALARTPVAANGTVGILSKMFNLAEEWGLRDEGTNPCRRIKKYTERKRERYLTHEEAIRLGNLLQEHKQYPDENLAAIYCLQLLLLTGCRAGEIMSLDWKSVDLDRRRIFLPDSKTGARTVYLGPSAVTVLQEIKACPARPPDNPYVIWGHLPNRPISRLKRSWAKFRKLMNMPDLRIHDLRHSFASFAVNQNIGLETIAKLLGHADVKTTARYAHLMEETVTNAAARVSGQIGKLIAIPEIDDGAEGVEAVAVIENPVQFIPKTNVPMPRYFTSDQAAHYLGLDPKSMKDWRYRKAGPQYHKIGNRIRYRQDHLDAFLHTLVPRMT